MITEDDPVVAKERKKLEAVRGQEEKHRDAELISVPFVCSCGTRYSADFKGKADSFNFTLLTRGDFGDKVGPCVYRVECECGTDIQIDVDCVPQYFRVGYNDE